MGPQLYLDTEFNGHGGELLSLALANPTKTGKHFYARLPDPVQWHPWVKEHVVPFFDAEPETMQTFRFRLREYLKAREGCTIYADWPADFQYLMEVMCGSAFEDSFMIPCSLVLFKDTYPAPFKPHNALSDAIALMEWHREKCMVQSTIRVTPDELPSYIEQYERQQAKENPGAE